jgi:Tol biopolymer transport system component
MRCSNRYRCLLGTLGLVLLFHSLVLAQTKGCGPVVSFHAVQTTFGPRAEVGPAISPDGKWVAFEYTNPTPPDKDQIWVMDLTRGFTSARPLVKDPNYNSWPSWSPDSQWVSFLSGRKVTGGNFLTFQLYKVRVSDGTVVQLTHFPNETALRDSTSWSRDGRIAFVYSDGIYAVSESGGEPEKLIDLTQTLAAGSLWGAVWSPDGSRLAFRGTPPGADEGDKRIWVADSNGEKIVQITKGFTDDLPSWLDNDHILFERWSRTGEVRIAVVCVRTLRINYLTHNHIDQSPAVDPTSQVLFFARAALTKKNIHAWLPETHIWEARIHCRPNG